VSDQPDAPAALPRGKSSQYPLKRRVGGPQNRCYKNIIIQQNWLRWWKWNRWLTSLGGPDNVNGTANTLKRTGMVPSPSSGQLYYTRSVPPAAETSYRMMCTPAG